MQELFISVIIVTRNRPEALKFTLDNFLQQDYSNKEIIVIDNNSEGIDWQIFKENYPLVTFILLNENHSLNAFDFGLEIAKGEIIWRTDDDSNPKYKTCFKKINEIFSSFEDIDIVATEIKEPLSQNVITDWYPYLVNKENVPENGYKSNTFYGAGAAIRRKVFSKIGTFWGFGYEELDFSSRAILAGFKIRYFPNIITDHYTSYINRNRSQRLLVMANQQVKYHAKYFDFPKAISRFFLILISQNIEAISIKISLTLLWTLNKGMINTFINTRKKERIKVPEELISDITLDENLLLSFLRYFKIRLRRFLQRK